MSQNTNVVMVGTSLIKSKLTENLVKDKTKEYDDVPTENISPKLLKNPAILVEVDTLKPVILQTKKKNKKNIDIGKIQKKKKKRISNSQIGNANSDERKKDIEELLLKKSSSNFTIATNTSSKSDVDIGKSVAEKLKYFQEMDDEFQNIIGDMNIDEIYVESYDEEPSSSNTSLHNQHVDETKLSPVQYPIGKNSNDLSKRSQRILNRQSKNLSVVNIAVDSADNILKTAPTTLVVNEGEEFALQTKSNDEIVSNTSSLRNRSDVEDSICSHHTKNSFDMVKAQSKIKEPMSDFVVEDFEEENENLHNILKNEASSFHDVMTATSIKFSRRQTITDTSLNYKPAEGYVPLKSCEKSNKNIHFFCTTIPTMKLDEKEKLASFFTHTPDMFPSTTTEQKQTIYEEEEDKIHLDSSSSSLEDSSSETVKTSLDENQNNKYSEIAERIMTSIREGNTVSKTTIKKLEEAVDELFEEKTAIENVKGKALELKDDMSRLVNVPPPPKFHLAPDLMKSHLANNYVSKHDDMEMDSSQNTLDVETDYSDILEDSELTDKAFKDRILTRLHHSLNDLDNLRLSDYESSSDDECFDDMLARFESVLERQRKKRNNERPNSAGGLDLKIDKADRRCHSQPTFMKRNDDESHSVFQTDFHQAMEETHTFHKQLEEMKKNFSTRTNLEEKRINTLIADVEANQHVMCNLNFDELKNDILTGNKTTLKRSQSQQLIEKDATLTGWLKRWKSESDINSIVVPQLRDGLAVIWLKENFWYKWLDEIYNLDSNISDNESIKTEDDKESSVSDIWKNEVSLSTDINAADKQVIENEIEGLTTKLEDFADKSCLTGFFLCRRGALQRKIGDFKNALIDLNSAINLEPKLLDCYWHRHLIYLSQGNTKKALEDLNYVTKFNPKHKNALRSKGEIYKKEGEIAMAITSFSQAINVDPKDPQLYYCRGELLEERGDTILALEDYKMADQLDPANTFGLSKIAAYHFEIESWMAAVGDYTSLISRNPKYGEAYLLRAQAYSKMGHYEKAIIDLSTSIYLQPDNTKAFYYRGCLLRKYSPNQALQDLSVSLMLDSTVHNVDAYNHRAILYTDLNMLDQALCDFELVIRLNRSFAPAHVNIGLIQMKKGMDLLRAIKQFNIALRVSPTYIRAIICRAEAYEKMDEIDNAIKDYTRAIMMNPVNIHYRVARGRLLLKKNEFELASFHIRQCAAMSSKKVSLSTQQAVVETFLKNHKKAIEILEVAVKSQPTMYLYTLLGKTFMKALRFSDAIQQFNIALDLVRPYNAKMTWPLEAGEIFFLIGMCYKELKRYPMSLDALNNSVRIDGDFALGFYERGLIKMKLGLSKGVHDFNKALACDPNFYQAYLARAMYYGVNKRYAKAIMNCNEAVRINPASVRAYLYRGSLKYAIKAYMLAVKDLSSAIDIDSCCWLAYFNRAICYHEKRFFFKALKDYSIVLIGPSNLKMKALLNRGLLYYQINDIPNAISDFSTALDTDPNNTGIILALGLCYQRVNNKDMSVEAYTQVLKINPFSSSALIGRGNVIMKDMDIINARRDFVRALHLNPLSTQTRINLAMSLQLEKRYMKAWNLFTKTLQLDPRNGAAYEGRALVSLRMGNTLGAFLDMNAAVNICRTAKSLTNRGVVNQCLGDVRAAMTDLQQAIKVDPSFSLAYYNVANLYFLNRQFEQAISFYNSAINWNPNDANAYINRAVAKTVLKGKIDVEGIQNDFNIAERLSPSWSHLHYNRALFHHVMQQYESADSCFTKAIELRPDYALFYKKRGESRSCLGANKLALDDFRKVISILG